MTVTITHEDIRKGRRYDPQRCPVALAIKRAAPQYTDTLGVSMIDVTQAFVITPSRVLELPDWVADFIADYDAHLPVGVQERSFELDL